MPASPAMPQAGVMALFAGLLAYGLLGSSRFAIVSSTSSSAAVLAAATASVLHVSDDLRHLMGVAMVLTAGVIFVVAGLARLGSVSQFIAKPVLRGFALGLALTIVVKQLPVAVAVHPAHSDFLRYAWDLLSQWRLWNLHGLAMMLAALLALRLLGRWKALPGALLVIAAGIGLDALGYCQAWGIAPVGTLAIGGSRPALPSLALADWLRVGQLAMALALILYAESYSSIRSLALRHGDAVSPNRDLVALGVANALSALFQGMPVGAGYSASSANEVAGARSKAAGLVACAVVGVLVWQLLPWMERIPEPLLAAIVIHAVAHTLSPAALRPYFAWRRDRLVALAAFVAVILLGVLDGLLLAIAVSIAMLLKRFAEPRVSWRPIAAFTRLRRYRASSRSRLGAECVDRTARGAAVLWQRRRHLRRHPRAHRGAAGRGPARGGAEHGGVARPGRHQRGSAGRFCRADAAMEPAAGAGADQGRRA